jgi:hypothetical protein
VGPVRELAVSRCRHWAGLGFGPVSTGAEPGPLLRTHCGASGTFVKPTWTRRPDERVVCIYRRTGEYSEQVGATACAGPARQLAVAPPRVDASASADPAHASAADESRSLVRPGPSTFPSGRRTARR